MYYFFNSANDGDWGNLSNWSSTPVTFTAVSSLPSSDNSDDVTLFLASVTQDSSHSASCNNLYIDSSTVYLGYGVSVNVTNTVYPNGFTGVASDGYFYVNGLIATGGYNGNHYTSGVLNTDTTTDYDYFLDNTYLYINGVIETSLTGYVGFFGCWLLNGVVSTWQDVGQLDSNGDGFPNFYYEVSTPYTNVLFINGTQANGVMGYNGVLWNTSNNGQDTTDAGYYPDYGYDPTGTTQYFFYNGSILNGGYNGVHYSSGFSDNFTGFDYDYYLDPTGVTQYFFITGSVFTGGYSGVHYSSGSSDSYTGSDYDAYYNATLFYYNGTALTGGYNGVHYTSGSSDPYTGSDYDYYYSTNLFYFNGTALTGGYNGVHYSSGSSDSYTGSDYDAYYNATLFYFNGLMLTGGYNAVHYTNGVSDYFTGFDWDYNYSYPIGYINGVVDTVNLYAGCNPLPLNYPDATNVKYGVSYGLAISPITGNFNALTQPQIYLRELLQIPY